MPILRKLAALASLALLSLPATGAELPTELAEVLRHTQAIAAARGAESDSARLRRLFDLYWRTELLASPELATWVGMPGLGGRWSDRSPETVALLEKIVREQQAALASIDRGALAAAEQVNYDLADRRLVVYLEAERFQGEFLQVGPMGGIDLTLLQRLDYLPARTVQDFETMLELLRGFPAEVERTLGQLGKGLAEGITPPRVTVLGVPERVGSLLADEPRQSLVLKRFTELHDSIPAAEQKRLEDEAARVYTEQVAPAVRKLRDYLADVYVPGARESISMSALPEGESWYAFQLKSSTTTDLSPAKIHELGLSEVRRIRAEMEPVIAATGFKGSFAEFCQFLRTDPRFFYERPQDLVAGYRDIAKRIDPRLTELFGRLPRLPYGVKPMEGEAAMKTAPPAYYNSGSLAGGLPGWFLVNTYNLKARPKWLMEALTLHEAVPGHHLQYALHEELEELPEWRKWDVYPAYSEGWALYAESLGSEVGLYQDPYSKFGQLTNEIWRAVRLVVDTGVHAYGWSRQQAIDYYRDNAAKTLHEIEREVDRIIAHPGTVPVYKLGELKIRELRRHAERELGESFDLRAFHDHLLGHGQLPLDLLEQHVKEWVQAARPAAPGRRPKPAG